MICQDFKKTVISRRLILRKLSDKDSVPFMNLMNRDNQDFSRSYTNYPISDKPYSESDARSLIQIFNNSFKSINARIYFISLIGSNEIIGAINTSQSTPNTASVSYYISSKYRRRGYAVEAQLAAIKRLQEKNQGIRFIAQVLDGNHSSNKVLIKNGFKFVGRRLPLKSKQMGRHPVLTFMKVKSRIPY